VVCVCVYVCVSMHRTKLKLKHTLASKHIDRTKAPSQHST